MVIDHNEGFPFTFDSLPQTPYHASHELGEDTFRWGEDTSSSGSESNGQTALSDSLSASTKKLQSAKRTHLDRRTDTPPSSPSKKKARPQQQSSIRQALESKAQPIGLLLFFKKATDSEHHEMLLKSTLEVTEKAEEVVWREERQVAERKTKRRRGANERKRKQRKNARAKEIADGLRSPGGTKKQVCVNQLGLKYADQATVQGGEA